LFDPNANPEALAARAAELSLEQLDRFRAWCNHRTEKNDFYKDQFEISISNDITRMMAAYAVLKGYVTYERANGEDPRY
jgi:hypothetical protein